MRNIPHLPYAFAISQPNDDAELAIRSGEVSVSSTRVYI